MSAAPNRVRSPRQAPLAGDLWIIVLGIWGFLRQTSRAWLIARKPDELASRK